MSNEPGKKARTLGYDYVRRIATAWPKLPHAQDIIEHLPADLNAMLQNQSDQFLLGFVNAIAVVHDLGIKELIAELVSRTGGTASEPRDILLTKVGSVVEGCSYLACQELLQRELGSQTKKGD